MNQAALQHTKMSLAHRCENALCGFLCLELFRMLADDKGHEMDTPTGASFLAPQTILNLQACVSLAISWFRSTIMYGAKTCAGHPVFQLEFVSPKIIKIMMTKRLVAFKSIR